MSRPTVLLVDDHLVFTADVVRLLSERFDVLGAITDVAAVLDIAATVRPDVIVLNTAMLGMTGLDALGRLVAAHKRSRVILLTMDTNPRLALDAMQIGADGFVLKHSSTAELAGAIDAVLAGHRYLPPALADRVVAMMTSAAEWGGDTKPLTSSQREILRLLVDGLPLLEIAEHLQLSPRTVETLKHDMMRDLGIQSTPELVKYALEHNLVPL
jgi:DNA-binding NarL/FixJ family response regulator